MFLCHSIYPLPRDGTFSAHINGEHDHDSRHKSYYQKEVRKPSFGAMPNPNIPGLAIVLNNTLPPRQPNTCFRATVIQFNYAWTLTLITCQ